MTDSGQPLRRAPRFIRNLHSQSVRRHADVKLSCKISGNPEPEVLWYKNGKQFTEIKEIVQYEIKEDHQVHTLHFIRCTEEDAAVYQISARNSLGMISGSAIIEVGPVTKAIIYQRLFRCPAKNTQTSSRNNSIKCIEGPAKGEPRLANAQEEHKDATSTPAALSSPITAQTHDQKPSDSQNTSTVGSHREQKSLHSSNTPDTFMAKRPKNKNRKRQPINSVILDEGGAKEAHSKALAQRPNPEGHRETTHRDNNLDLRIFEESDLCEPVTRPASEGHTRCVRVSEQEDPKAHFGSAKKTSPADERLVNDSGQLGRGAVRGGQCQETGQVGTARSAPERQPIDDVSLKEEVCVCVQETHHTNDVTLLNKGALTGPENHIGEVTGLNKDNCLAASENHHRTDDVRPKKGDSTIGPKIHFADDVNLNEGGCCITVSESEPADDSRMSREGCVTFSESYHARDVSLSQESCVSAPKNHLTDKVQLSKEGCFTAPQSECADDVRSGKEEDFMTGSESHPLDDVSLSNVAGIPATKSYNADDVTDFSRKFCTTAPECRHARDARQKKRDYMIGPESHRDDDVRLRKEDSMMGLEKRHADDVSLNQQVRLNGYDHYPSDWPVWQGVSGDTVTRGPPIGLCDNQSDSGEAAAKGARPEGTHPDPGTDMVLSAGHRQQHDLPPLKAHKRVKLAVAIQNDSAAIEEEGRGGRKAAGGCAPPVPHASDEVREASGDPLLAEEVTKLMTEKTTVEGLSEGSPMGTPARRPAKEDGSKTRKVNSAGGRCDPTLNKSSLENEVTTLAGGTGNCREIAMDPGSCVLQQQTATHRATPVTLHIEELDVANHCEGRSGLPDTATACSANAVQEIPMMCEMDFAGSTNVMCHLVTEDPTALIVPPLTESGNMSPSSKLCNDSCAGSEGLGFLHGDCKGSSSPPQVKQCVCDDKDIDCHCVCENPETAIVENPIFYSFDRDSDINIVINNQFSKEVPPLFIESAGDKMEYIGHMECSDGKMKSIEHIESVESKRGSIVHGEEVSRTYQEEGLPIPGVQAVHVSVFHSDEIAVEEAVYHLLTNDACDRLSDDFEQGLIEDICPSSSNYDKTSIIISDTVAEHYPPCRSVDCYEVAHCTDTHSSYLKTLFYLNQEPASSICTESADCFLNSNQPAQVGESVLDGFNQVPSSITFDFGQSDQVQQNHSQLPQLLVLETPNGTFINESDGQLIDEIKTLFEVFRQSLEESIQGQRHDLGLSMQEDSSGCPAQISLNSKDSDINFNSSTQVNSPCADTQNLVDKSEEVTDVDAQGKGAFGNCSEISITMSIKALMEEYMLNEHVLDSFNDKPDSIQYLEADSEVPSERKFPLLDHSETDDSIEQVNADAEWALIEKERVKQLQETTTECHSEEPEMSQPFSVCQICTREPSPVQDSDITTANISWDAGGDVSDSDSINKTHAQDVVTTRDPQSPEAFPDQKKNSFMDAMKTYEYLVNSEQPPDLSQLCTIKAPCNSSMDVDSDVVQDMFHTEVECENKSVFYVCSEDLTSNSCTSYISDNKHQLSSLCNHRESIEHSLPLPAMEKTKVSVQLPNTEIKMAVLTTCNAEEQVPLHQSENKGQEECLEMPSAKDVLVSLPSSLRTIPSIQKELELGSDFKDVCVRSHKDGPSNLVENLSTLPEDTQPGAADYLPSSNKGLALHFQCSQSTFQSTPLVLELDKKELKEGGICLLENTLKEEAIIKERKLEHEINEGLSIENEKAPQSLDDIDVHTSQRHSENMQLSNHFPEIHNDVAITNGSELVSQVTKSTDKEPPASLNITQISRAEKEVYNCSQKEYENMETEMGVTSEELDPFPGYPCTEGGEEIEFNQLFFRDDFISDSYFSGNIHGKIATEELHFGEGVHRKAFRSKVIYGLVPVFRPGHVCVLKVHNAVAYGTKTTDELIQRNYKLAAQECYVQNTAREYAKMYAAEAEHLEDFGRVPEIIPIFLIHRLANHIPYATVEEELVGDFVKYSIRDGKEINFMRRDSEAGQKCCTFQHWVFQKTSGNLLVTDMQGVGMKLTDVGIATLAKGYKGFKGNCSISFIEQFKVLHLCNKYCEMLGLKSLQKQKKPGAAKTKAPPTPSASSRKTVGGARPKGKR